MTGFVKCNRSFSGRYIWFCFVQNVYIVKGKCCSKQVYFPQTIGTTLLCITLSDNTLMLIRFICKGTTGTPSTLETFLKIINQTPPFFNISSRASPRSTQRGPILHMPTSTQTWTHLKLLELQIIELFAHHLLMVMFLLEPVQQCITTPNTARISLYIPTSTHICLCIHL